MNTGSQSSGSSSSTNPMTSLRKRRLKQHYARFQEEHSNSDGEGSDNPDRVNLRLFGKKPKTDAFDILLQADRMRNYPGQAQRGRGKNTDLTGNPTGKGCTAAQAHESEASGIPTSLGPRRNSVPKDDKLLQTYQQTGALDEVFGSQSVLSQELISLKHHPTFPSPETHRIPKQNDIEEISGPDQCKSSSPPQPPPRPPSASMDIKQEHSQMSISVSSLPDLPFSQSIPQSIPQSMPFFSSQLSHLSALNDESFLNAADMEAEETPTKPVKKGNPEVRKQGASPSIKKQGSNRVQFRTNFSPGPNDKELTAPFRPNTVPSIDQMKQEVIEKLSSSHDSMQKPGSPIQAVKERADNSSAQAPIEMMLGAGTVLPSSDSHLEDTNIGDPKKFDAASASTSSTMLRPYSAVLSSTDASPQTPMGSTFPSATSVPEKIVNLPITQEAAGPHNPEDPMLLEMAELAARERRIASLNPGQGLTTWVPIKTKKQRFAEQTEAKELAAQAAKLVAEMAVNRKVEKQLLLSMTLTRESPRSANAMPPPGNKLKPGFHWGHFPPLEKLLRSHMEEYYELSIKKCQSTLQQEFNNRLVKKTQYLAYWHGWAFEGFSDRELRDRIRCFFKTHIQNAKKRLKTMIKNPSKKANAKALVMHFDLIQKHNRTHQELQFANDYMKDRGKTFQKKNPDVKAEIEDQDAAKVLMQGFKKKVLYMDEREF